MSERIFLARILLPVGGGLAVLGAILWLALPIRPMFPPFLATSLLSIGYGLYCRRVPAHRAPPAQP